MKQEKDPRAYDPTNDVSDDIFHLLQDFQSVDESHVLLEYPHEITAASPASSPGWDLLGSDYTPLPQVLPNPPLEHPPAAPVRNPPASEPSEPRPPVQVPVYTQPIPFWVLFTGSDCSCCALLRQTVHANDFGTIKMDIHGGIGTFHHAMLEVVDAGAGAVQNYMADFSGFSHRAVKEFLLAEEQIRQQKGMVLVGGSINEFQEALCVGMGTPSSSAASASGQHAGAGSSSG